MNISRRIWRKFFTAYIYLIGSRIAVRKLNGLADKYGHNVEKLVDLAFTFEFKQKVLRPWSVNVKPLQVKSEIIALCQIIQKLNPKTIAEIGTASGGTLFLFSHIVNPETIISIDLPGGSFGGGYPFWKIPLLKSIGKNNIIKLIRADSHDENTLEIMKNLLKGKKIDVLFIDGDHTYEGVKQDFQMYSSLVRKGGLIAFHDIVTHDPTVGCEVDKFWHEIKQSYCHIEIIEQTTQKWAGIGVLDLRRN